MTAMKPCPKCHSAEHPHIGAIGGNSTAGRPVEAGCTGCHAPARPDHVPTGPFADGRRPGGVQSARGGIAVTGKGYLTMGGRTYAAHADCGGSACAVGGFTAGGSEAACGKCEPEGVGHDR